MHSTDIPCTRFGITEVQKLQFMFSYMLNLL